MTMDYLPSAHDLVFHLFRTEGIAEGFAQGQGVVRIQTSQLGGAGYPVSIMYGDILLYPVALLRHLGLPMVLCYQLYVVLINILAAILAYHTARTIAQSRGIALLACSIWTLSPYRLTDVYVRASVGEYTALSFIPAIILGLYFIFYATEDTTKRPWLWLAVGVSGVVLSHIISVLIVTIAVVIPFIVLLIKRHDRFVWSQLIKSLLRILGISLFFLIPFLDYYSMNNLAVTQISADTSRSAAAQAAVEPGQLFELFPIFSGLIAPVQAGVSDDLPLTLGWSLISGVLLALFICAHAKWNDKTTRNNILVINLTCIVIAIGILYMSSVFFPWQRTLPLGNQIIALLASIQFPWRLIGAVDTLLLIPLCIGFAYLERSKSFHALGHIVLTALLAFSLIEGATATGSFLNHASAIPPFSTATSDAGTLGVMNGEYLPAGTNRDQLVKDIANNKYPQTQNATMKEFAKSGTTITVWATANPGGSIDLPLLYYPNYKLQGVGNSRASIKCGDNNMLRITFPHEFNGELTVRFEEPLSWKCATWISIKQYWE